jgi:serine/threonine-protein kinase HipA
LRLDVHLRGNQVAKLYRERDEYVLEYSPHTDPENFVSLAMPVQSAAWRWPRDLHPFFRQNLPEGSLLDIIREEFGPLLDGTDLSLLAVVGGFGIGRVTITPEGEKPNDLEPLDFAALLTGENSSQRFKQLMRRYARAAISGAVPKFVAPGETPPADGEPMGKATLRTSRHIIKGSDEATPYLAFNEFYSLRILERLNVAPVAKTRMSEDGRVLIVERFDVDSQGTPVKGLEDACSLLGLPPHEKYRPSMEKVLKATRAYIPPPMVRDQLVQFGWHLLSNYVVRNADCHSKNIALLYSDRRNVGYSPIYDLVTTQAYPSFANREPGLSIGGRKTWAPGKSLEQFFKAQLGIPPHDYAAMVEQLCESAVKVGEEMSAAAKNEPRWRDVAERMLQSWNEGMTSLRRPKGATRRRGTRTTVGRSELLGKR